MKELCCKGAKIFRTKHSPEGFKSGISGACGHKTAISALSEKEREGKKEEMPPETACRPLDNLDIYAYA